MYSVGVLLVRPTRNKKKRVLFTPGTVPGTGVVRVFSIVLVLS